MIVLSQEDIKKLSQRKHRAKRMAPVKPPALAERELKRRLQQLWERVLQPASTQIMEMVKVKAMPSEIANYMSRILREAEDIYGFEAKEACWRWQQDVNNITRAAMQRGLSASFGVDVTALLDNPQIAEALSMAEAYSANLIKTIPGGYLGEVAQAVSDSFWGRPLPEGRSLLAQIQEIGKVSRRRAVVIARHQTSILTAELNKVRQESIGITLYEWRDVEDNRVVGLPGGKYPNPTKLHGNHYLMNHCYCKWADGDVYSKDKGKTWLQRPNNMKGAIPGSQVGCRCWPYSVINIQEIIQHARTG